uniref:Uncharacterized protein n=1 Tax=Panagrolaimus sp. JU765 TaxID=591449 RepID=A0AC34QAT4_9BILA
MCSALMLNESKTYALQVPQTGFLTFIICGNITGNGTELTKICYDGKAKSNEHLTCQKESYCGIQVAQLAGFTHLTAEFGGRIANFNETSEHLHWILPVGGVIGAVVVVVIIIVLIYCLYCKKKKLPEVENQPLLAIIAPPKPVGSTTVEIDMIEEHMARKALLTSNAKKSQSNVLLNEQGDEAKRQPSETNVLCVDQPLNASSFVSTPNVAKSATNVKKQSVEPEIVKDVCPQIVVTPKTPIVEMDKKITTQEEVKQEKMPLKTSGVEEGGRNKEEIKMKVKTIATQKEVEKVAVKTPLIPFGGVKNKDKLELKRDKTTTEEKAGPSKLTKTSVIEKTGRTKTEVEKKATKTASEDDLRTGRLSNVSTPIAKTPRTSVDGNKNKDNVGIKNDAQKTTTEEDAVQPGPSKMESKFVTGRDGRKMEVIREAATTQKEVENEAVSSKMPKLEGISVSRGGARKASESDLEEKETQAPEISHVARRYLKEAESKKKVTSKKSSKRTKSGKSKKTRSGKSKKGSRSGQSKKKAEDERRTGRMNYDSLSVEEEAALRHHLSIDEEFRRAFDKIARDGSSDEPDLKTAEEKKSVVEEFYPGYLSRGLLQPKISTDLIVSRKRRNSADGGRRTDSTDH